MMTKFSAPNQTERQKLGGAILFFRQQRKLSQRDIAERVGVSVSEYDDWETGKHAPPPERWRRLVNMLHDNLGEMRATWQRALGEDQYEKDQQRAHSAPLTNKPFAGLDKLVEAQPKLTVVPPPPPAPPPAPVPETLHDDGFDLRPAYKAVKELPEGWNTADAKMRRWDYARELIVEGKLRTEEIISEVKRKFGVGISPNTLTEIRDKVQDAKRRVTNRVERAVAHVVPPPTPSLPFEEPIMEAPPQPVVPVATPEQIDYARMLLRKSPSMKIEGSGGLDELLKRKFGQTLEVNILVQLQNEARAQRVTGPMAAVQPPPATVNENDIEGAVRLILEAIPNLRSFKVEVDDAGEVHVSHTVREVRVVESSGTMKLKKP